MAGHFLLQLPDELGYNRFMQKQVEKILKVGEETVLDDFVPGTMSERLEMVWPLTVEIVSLTKIYDVEQRLRRDIAVFKRREG